MNYNEKSRGNRLMKKNNSSHLLVNKKPYYYKEHSSGLSKVVNQYVKNYPLNKKVGPETPVNIFKKNSNNFGLTKNNSNNVKMVYKKEIPMINNFNEVDLNYNIAFKNKGSLTSSFKSPSNLIGERKLNVKDSLSLSEEINHFQQENDKLNVEIKLYKRKIQLLEKDVLKLKIIRDQQIEEYKKKKFKTEDEIEHKNNIPQYKITFNEEENESIEDKTILTFTLNDSDTNS